MRDRQSTHPFVFFFLVLPYGISSGFVSITLPFILTRLGFSVALAASIVAIGVSANLWRFLWGPVADLTLTARRRDLFCIRRARRRGRNPRRTNAHFVVRYFIDGARCHSAFHQRAGLLSHRRRRNEHLWSAVAPDWNATPDQVALVSGVLNGVISAIGCVIGGWVADCVGRWWSYFGSGILIALVAIIMAVAPRTPNAFTVGILAYALI